MGLLRYMGNAQQFLSSIKYGMRYLARATQTGLTQAYSPFGNILKSAPSDVQAALTADIYKINRRTFYSVHGDILARAFIMAAMLLLLARGVARKKAAAHE